MRRAAALTGELARAATVEEVRAATLGAGVRALGAKSGALVLMDHDDSALRIAGTIGFDDAIASRYVTIPLDSEVPVATAARTLAPVFVRSRREMSGRHGVPDEHIGEHQSWAALPLIGRSRRLGVLALSFADPQSFDEPAQAELQRLASQCAQALDRALALEALESATRRLHATLEAGSIGTYSWDVGADRFEHDAGIARIFDLDRASGHDLETFAQRIHPDDRAQWLAALAESRTRGVDLEVRFRVVRGDGTMRWVLDKGQTLKDEEGRTTCLVGAVVDLTGEHHARESAERASRAKDEFLAMLGHELRNPLAPIRTALELMQLRGGDALRKERNVIERQVDHMVRLVDDLLDVSRITRGSVELRLRPLDLAEVFSKAREIAVPLFERKLQRVEIDVAAGLSIVADAHRMTQVIANLLTNAAKYTPARGRIAVRARAEDGDVVLEVHDEGVGIGPDLLPRLFDAFVQGERTIERSEGGLGLGLTIVKTLVEMHGGTIRAASEGRGRGSTFTLRLPRAPQLVL
ncbi:MAG: ATP-binding protein, partial [Myxococcota bacterium]|nr:ATP-binding protein [Myxococcota bacterium]